MNDSHRPAEPVEEGKKKRVGFAEVARRLNELYPDRKRPISRQLVNKWYIHRGYNQFPAPLSLTKGGTGRPEFDMKAVEKWYAGYYPTHGGAPTPTTPKLRATKGGSPDTTQFTGGDEENPLAA